MTYRLQHVSVPRPPGSAERTRDFYSALLGLEEIPAPTTITTVDVIWFKLNDSDELHIFEEEPLGGASLRHFCLVVEDLEATRRKLVDAGYTPWDEEPIPGRPRFFCRDPNGNMIEFTSIVGNYLDYQDS
ncbi:MAG: VOC family protein [Chloroflexota bacterium]|nr:VOC family protein [Chloroflexota bacterium]